MTRRIEYIDAMRGLAMIMVVIGHFFSLSFHYYNPLFLNINATLQLPLFFMISGFFAPHMLKESFMKAVWDKFSRLIIPAILMFSIFVWIFNLNYVKGFYDPLKYGYWFTFVMFGYTIIYILVSRFTKVLGLSNKTSTCIHLISGVLITYIGLGADGLCTELPTLDLFSVVLYNYYFYYVLGAVLFAKKRFIINLLCNKRLLGGGVVFYSIGQIALAKYGTYSLRYGAGITNICIVSVALLIIWKLFDSYPQLSKTSAIGRFFTLVGRRSLDVYFIHYFFIPKDLSSWGLYFQSIDGVFISYLCAIILSIPLIYVSMGVGYILRLSPITSKLLLGVSNKKPTTVNTPIANNENN